MFPVPGRTNHTLSVGLCHTAVHLDLSVTSSVIIIIATAAAAAADDDDDDDDAALSIFSYIVCVIFARKRYRIKSNQNQSDKGSRYIHHFSNKVSVT